MAKNIIFLLTLLTAAQAAPAAAQVAVSTQAPVTVDQAYRPVNSRDPLVPATVFGDQKGTGKLISAAPAAHAAAPAAAAAPEAQGAFNVNGLTLTGILEDSSGRQALLRDSATGTLYTLRAGRLRDAKRKTVRGVSGVVKGKQVILITEDKKVHQFNLRQ